MKHGISAIKFDRQWAPEALGPADARQMYNIAVKDEQGAVKRGRGAARSSATGGYASTVIASYVFTMRNGTRVLMIHSSDGNMYTEIDSEPLNLDSDY